MLLALLRIGLGHDADAIGFAEQWTAGDAPQVDQALQRIDGHRLVIEAVDGAGLNLALARLHRAGLLGELETGVVVHRAVPYLSQLGLPADPAAQLALARTGRSRLAGVIRDDSGGVCISGARLSPWVAEHDWWVRAVVDDQPLCDGLVRSITVRHAGPSEVVAEVRLGRLRRRTRTGRSLQLACDPAQIVADGIPRERPRGRRTFWAEPKLWRLVMP
ncbi:MAG TPA: hypothetical protein VHO01_11565 [Jatrophihabitans sp.]|nr:hypothetical protein [Jatrophihabitans sp.]